MLVTIRWMSENYNKYNNLYFGGKLPVIEFKISRSKKTWGYAEYKFSRSKNTVRATSITMSNYYDAPEDVKLTTLLHEMIHVEDYTLNPHHFVRNGQKCHYDAHGWWFRKEAARLKKYGWDIQQHVTAGEKSQACAPV